LRTHDLIAGPVAYESCGVTRTIIAKPGGAPYLFWYVTQGQAGAHGLALKKFKCVETMPFSAFLLRPQALAARFCPPSWRRPHFAVLAVELLSLQVLPVPVLAQQGQAAGVGVAVVEAVSFGETAPVIGRIVAPTRSIVAARVAGVVDETIAQVGDHVTAGALLARLDDTLLTIEQTAARARVDEAEAGLAVSRANLDLAVQGKERVERLQGSAAFSRGRFEDLVKEVEVARSAVVRAEAAVSTAKVDLARAAYNLNHTQIRAPFDGVVLDRAAQPGAYIAIGQPVATLLDDTNLEVEADVPAELIAGLVVGAPVDIDIADGIGRVASRVRAIVPDELATTRTRPVRFSLDFAYDPGRLASGQSVTVHIPAGVAREVVAVPKDALVQSPRGWIVYVAIEGAAQPRPVQIGAAVDDRFEVLDGLAPGEIVVTRGNERLRPGQAIQFEPPQDVSAQRESAGGAGAATVQAQ